MRLWTSSVPGRAGDQLGTTHFVLSGEDAMNRVNGALGGMPDVVLECAGAPGILAQALEHVGSRGTIVMLGFAPPRTASCRSGRSPKR